MLQASPALQAYLREQRLATPTSTECPDDLMTTDNDDYGGPRPLSFSQRYGYAALPEAIQHESLDERTRTDIYNCMLVKGAEPFTGKRSTPTILVGMLSTAPSKLFAEQSALPSSTASGTRSTTLSSS